MKGRQLVSRKAGRCGETDRSKTRVFLDSWLLCRETGRHRVGSGTASKRVTQV
jgi:hypothetical protein